MNTVFWEPVHQVLKKIKNEPYFKWPNKMGGSYEVQLKSSLSIPPGTGAYYPGLQNSVEPSGATGKRGKVTIVFISAQ